MSLVADILQFLERHLTLFRFIHEDKTYNYISGRFPPDTALLAKRTVELVKQVYQS